MERLGIGAAERESTKTDDGARCERTPPADDQLVATHRTLVVEERAAPPWTHRC